MATLANEILEPRSTVVTNVARLDADTAWAAFMRRDRAWDGRVIGAVKTTGIYCKPSCPARRPKREHVEFFATADEARAAAAQRACIFGRRDAEVALEQALEMVRRIADRRRQLA